MAKKVGKTEDGREVFGYDFAETKVKSIGENEIEMIGSTDYVDRDGESIDPKGWNLKNYKKNPVIIPAHDYRQPAIGRAKRIQLKDGKLIFRIEFPPEGDNPVADVYRKLYKGGFMTASSVGFIPQDWVEGDGKKGSPARTYTKAELLELSLVSVPSNPEALATQRGIKEAVSKGVLSGDDVNILKAYAEDAFQKEGEEDVNIIGWEEAEEKAEIEGFEEAEEKQGDFESEEDENEGHDTEQTIIKFDIQEQQLRIDTLEAEVIKLQDILEAFIKQDEEHKQTVLKNLEKVLPKSYLDLPVQGTANIAPKPKFNFGEIARDAFGK